MSVDLNALSIPQLMQQYTIILEILRSRKVIRTENSPIGDYAEWLVASKLGLKLMGNSTSGYDAISPEGVKYQIKSRRITDKNRSIQLSAIRKLDNHDFDYLIVVLFNARVEILQVLKIPHEIIHKYARYQNHVNGYILLIRGDILSDPLTKDLTPLFCDNYGQ